MKIISHFAAHADAAIAFILDVQNTEFNLGTRVEDQADLLNVAEYYQKTGGDFWLAVHDGQVVGTIALRNLGQGQAALRKLYVAQNWRGSGLAEQLLQHLCAAAQAIEVKELYLATAGVFASALRFYEKQGFVRVELASLPLTFPRIPQETHFYFKNLKET